MDFGVKVIYGRGIIFLVGSLYIVKVATDCDDIQAHILVTAHQAPCKIDRAM